MGKRAWVISDTHFGHNLLVQADTEGRRPFTTYEEMDDALVEAWNSVVRPTDRVYHLGDVAMNRRHLKTLARCHGKKVLCKGNHDIFALKDYLPLVDDIRSYIVYPNHGVILSHVPIHPHQLGSRFRRNVHGHTHNHHIKQSDGTLDPRYVNVCVDVLPKFQPVPLDSLLAYIPEQDQ